MSYIADIRAIFELIEPAGTFLFSSEVRADDTLRNIAASAFPIFVIDDAITQNTVINQDAGATDSPRLKIYCLTKYDLSSAEVDENNQDRFYQHEQCVAPMMDLAIRVMGKYFQGGGDVSRQRGVKPTMNITDEYNLWSKMLYGVSMTPSNLNLRRLINYCDV